MRSGFLQTETGGGKKKEEKSQSLLNEVRFSTYWLVRMDSSGFASQSLLNEVRFSTLRVSCPPIGAAGVAIPSK